MKVFAIIILSVTAMAQQPRVNPLQIWGFSDQYTNAGSGTTLHNLVKIVNNHVVQTATTDTAVPVYIVIYGAGTTGIASIAKGGQFPCQMDASGATAGHFIGQSTLTGGRCADLGATAPATGWTIGIAVNTVGANLNANIDLLQGYNAAASVTISPYTLCASGCSSTIGATGTTYAQSTIHQGPGAIAECFDSLGNYLACGSQNSGTAIVAGNLTITFSLTPTFIIIYTPGGVGSAGPTGATGPTGANGTNGAISRIYNSGSSLPVEPFLNFVNGGCVDNSGATRTDCTVSGGGAGNGPNLPSYAQTGGGTGATIGGNLTSASPYNLINNGVLAASLATSCAVGTFAGTSNDTIYVSGNPVTGRIELGFNSGNTYTGTSNCAFVSGAANFTGEQILYTITITGGAWPASVNAGYGSQVAIVAPGTNMMATKDPITGIKTLSIQPSPIFSGTAAFTINATAFSATPVFNLALGNIQTITLTGNVSSSTVSNPVTGDRLVFNICQDATGSRTFVWPTGFKGAMTIGSTASKCNVQEFYYDGTSYWGLSAGLTNQ